MPRQSFGLVLIGLGALLIVAGLSGLARLALLVRPSARRHPDRAPRLPPLRADHVDAASVDRAVAGRVGRKDAAVRNRVAYLACSNNGIAEKSTYALTQLSRRPPFSCQLQESIAFVR